MTSGPCHFWVVYDHPSDYPDGYIARRHDVYAWGSTPSEVTRAAANITILRAYLSSLGLIMIPRDPSDEPQILETWL